MTDLHPRQINFLNMLINNEKVTIQDFAKICNVSTRTVYREISSINKHLSKFNIEVKNTEDGLTLEGNDEEINTLKATLPYLTQTIKPKSAINLIIIELLQSKEPIKIQYFASKFDVSNSTISSYLKEIKEWLEGKGIRLLSRPGVGTYIVADERSIRHAIIDLLYRNYNTDELLGLLQKYSEPSGNAEIKSKHKLQPQLLDIIDYDIISAIERAMKKFETNMSCQLEDRLYVELLVHLSLAIKRLQGSEKIDMDSSTLEKLKSTPEYKESKILAHYIEEEIHLKIPEEEIGYITIHLQGLSVSSKNLNISEKYICLLTAKIIKNASKIFNINFDKDLILKKGLNKHLTYSLYRLKSGFKIRNPLLLDIKREYKDIFDKCSKTLELSIKDLKIEINDDEIGYISMHIAASIERMKNNLTRYNVLILCSSGIGVSRMLAAKLKGVRQLNIVAVSSVLKVDEMLNAHNVDVIISTVPVLRDDVKVIVVNPLLTSSDVKKLEQELNIKISAKAEQSNNISVNNSKDARSLKAYITEINTIVKDTFYIEISASDKETIIQELLNELVRNNLINFTGSENIKVLLQNRDNLGTIVLPNKNFVIYHCVSADIKQPTVAVGKLKEPINLKNMLGKNEKVCTTFLMVSPENDKESIEVIGDISSSIIEHPDFVDRLNKSNSLEECRLLIQETLLNKLYEQIVRTYS